MLVGAVYNITDQIFIGHVVGMLGNAATNIVFPTVTLTTGISMLFGIGTASNFSMNQGAGNIEEAKRYVHTGITGAAAAGVITGLLLFVFKSNIVALCGADPAGAVYPLAITYLSVTMFGLPFHLFTQASAPLIRADGSPSYSMLCMVEGAVLNVFLDWLFMFPMGMGLKGAAIATAISQFSSCVLAVLYYPRFRAFRISVKELGISVKHLTGSMRAGIPNFIKHSAQQHARYIRSAVDLRSGDPAGRVRHRAEVQHDNGVVRGRHIAGMPAYMGLQSRSQKL